MGSSELYIIKSLPNRRALTPLRTNYRKKIVFIKQEIRLPEASGIGIRALEPVIKRIRTPAGELDSARKFYQSQNGSKEEEKLKLRKLWALTRCKDGSRVITTALNSEFTSRTMSLGTNANPSNKELTRNFSENGVTLKTGKSKEFLVNGRSYHSTDTSEKRKLRSIKIDSVTTNINNKKKLIPKTDRSSNKATKRDEAERERSLRHSMKRESEKNVELEKKEALALEMKMYSERLNHKGSAKDLQKNVQPYSPKYKDELQESIHEYNQMQQNNNKYETENAIKEKLAWSLKPRKFDIHYIKTLPDSSPKRLTIPPGLIMAVAGNTSGKVTVNIPSMAAPYREEDEGYMY